MNSHQRRKLRRLQERAFGTHVCYEWTMAYVPDEGDGINLCEKCCNYTTGRLCRSCREQEMIDNAELLETEDDLRYKNGWYL